MHVFLTSILEFLFNIQSELSTESSDNAEHYGQRQKPFACILAYLEHIEHSIQYTAPNI